MKVIVISEPKEIENEIFILHQMFEEGLELFHIRKPKLSTSELKKYISRIDKKYHNRIVIHTHHELAATFHLRGIHLTEKHRTKNFFGTWFNMRLIRWKREEVSISTSLHQLQSLLDYNEEYEYVFLSPIFDSISKIGYKNSFNPDSLKKTLRDSRFKVIAMGGVDITKIEQVVDFGFDGFALLGGLWQSENPVVEFKNIMNKCRSLNLL